ncbi:MAG: hypothetical protein HQL69_12470 [Magnetococcales bacterium]|nr:hypothetical protein [Magnetococcales bacterium]
MADITDIAEDEQKPNVLFFVYGGLVNSYFDDGNEEGTPISVIPSKLSDVIQTIQSAPPAIPLHEIETDDENIDAIAGSGDEFSDVQQMAEELQPLVSQNIPKLELQKTQEMVDSFRRILKKKNRGGTLSKEEQGEDEQLLASYLKEFRSALESGDESMLDANPFYELTKQVYKLSLDGVKNGFIQYCTKGEEPLPRSIYVSRSLKDIWKGAGSARKSFFDKLSETFGKWMAFCRTPLSLLLFVGSTYTTARGVNDLLQMSDVAAVFGDFFAGSSGESNRYIVCLASGLVLSSAILDYKTRIFQSMVECGLVLQGIKDAFLRNPRWMIIATILAFVSIKTNYDGIVSIISKKEDLAQQSQIITSRVRKALGSPFFMNPTEPDSLFDLQGSFQQTTREIRGVFRTLPEDEVKGVASSGDPRKGPRYWAKHFIVHGGYEAGINDVKLAFNDHKFASRIDEMLKNSGIDFSSSFSEKVELLRSGYEAHLSATDDLVRKHLGELNILMSMGGYSLDEIKRVLALEHYQINDIVQIIVGALEDNKQVYKETSVDLSELTNTYLGILQLVDKSGTSGLSAYHIKADVEVPKIEAIDELREGKIPVAKHKNFEELRAALMQQYGISLGGMLLAFILFFSISMDFGDPIVYSRMTARRGKKDRVFFKDRLAKLKKWEADFFKKAESFFEIREVREVFLDPQVPGETLVRDAFYRLLENSDPEIKDDLDKTKYQRFDHWFQGMFRFSRTTDMAGLNGRLAMIRKVLVKPERFFPLWGVLIYPDFQVDKAFSRTTFREWHDLTSAQLNEKRVAFYQELRDVAKAKNIITSELPTDLSPAQKRLTRWADDKGINIISKSLALGKRYWYTLFKSVTKEPIPSFSYTRRGWLQDFSENSLESEKIVESIYSIIPVLKKVVFETLPTIQEKYLEPILDFLVRYPGYEGSSSILSGPALQQQFDEIEKEALDLWGVSFFASDDPNGYLGLSSIMSAEEITNLQEMVEKTGADSVVFTKRVDKLTADMESAFIIVSTTEEINQLLTQIRTICVDVNQSLMKIKMRAWEFRGGSVGNGGRQYLDAAKELQDNAPKESDSILSVMEAILQSNQPYTRNNLNTLRTLFQQASELQDRIMAFVDFDQSEGENLSFNSTPQNGFEAVLEPSQSAPQEVYHTSDSIPQEDEEPEVDSSYTPQEDFVDNSSAVPPPAVFNPDDEQAIMDVWDENDPDLVEQPAVNSYSTPVTHSDFESSDRQEERVQSNIMAVYESSRGARFEGQTGDISASSLDFLSTTDPSMLPIGNEGTLQLLYGGDAYNFSSKVVRVFESRIVVRITSDKSKFEELLAHMVS